MKKVILIVAILIVLALVAAFVYLKGNPTEITITQSQINAKLAEDFPAEKTYFAIFRITLDNPEVTLLPETNRVRVALAANVDIKVPGQKDLDGNLIVTSGIRYDNEEKAVYLTDPEIENVQIDQIPQKHLDKIKSVASKAASDFLTNQPIYHLDAKDAKTKAANLLLKSIEVKEQGVVLSLGI